MVQSAQGTLAALRVHDKAGRLVQLHFHCKSRLFNIPTQLYYRKHLWLDQSRDALPIIKFFNGIWLVKLPWWLYMTLLPVNYQGIKELEIALFQGSSSFTTLEVYEKVGEGLATFLTWVTSEHKGSWKGFHCERAKETSEQHREQRYHTYLASGGRLSYTSIEQAVSWTIHETLAEKFYHFPTSHMRKDTSLSPCSASERKLGGAWEQG